MTDEIEQRFADGVEAAAKHCEYLGDLWHGSYAVAAVDCAVSIRSALLNAGEACADGEGNGPPKRRIDK